MDFQQFYHLESYLLDTVRPRFLEQGYLSAFDFFCIVIWKSNRAKSKIAKRLLSRGYEDLERAVHTLTTQLFQQVTAKDKLYCLWNEWRFRLPMASAILTILYPDEFTVYDYRVCAMLGDFYNLSSITRFENLWVGYERFKQSVEKKAPSYLSLRDKDRYLWGKSFSDALELDIAHKFTKQLPLATVPETDYE